MSQGDSCYTVVDIPAESPGGLAAWNKYFERNFNPMLDSTENNHQGGTLTVTFTVQKDGILTGFLIKNPKEDHATLEAAYIKIIKEGPKWLPAIKNGSKVASKITWATTICMIEE